MVHYRFLHDDPVWAECISIARHYQLCLPTTWEEEDGKENPSWHHCPICFPESEQWKELQWTELMKTGTRSGRLCHQLLKTPPDLKEPNWVRASLIALCTLWKVGGGMKLVRIQVFICSLFLIPLSCNIGLPQKINKQDFDSQPCYLKLAFFTFKIGSNWLFNESNQS